MARSRTPLLAYDEALLAVERGKQLPKPMTSITASVVSDTAISVSDVRPADDVPIRAVRRTRELAAGGGLVSFDDAPSTTGRTFSGLTASTEYRFTSATVDTSGNVSASVETTATTQAPPPPPPPATTLVFNRQFSDSGTFGYVNNSTGSYPEMWVESGSPALVVGSGVCRQSVSGGKYGRWMSNKRMGGPGKSLVLHTRSRATSIPGGVNMAGNAFGIKFPRSSSLTGYSRDDVRSVIGTDSTGSPSYVICRYGVNVNQRMEAVYRTPGAGGSYPWTPGASGWTKSPYDWRESFIRFDWLTDNRIRVRAWGNVTSMSGTPFFNATSPTLTTEVGQPAFLWSRVDGATIEWDFITVEEV